MEYRKLGNSGLLVSSLCLGTMTFGSGFFNIAGLGQEEATPMVKEAIAAGINFIDTANVYSRGESETLLGNALKSLKVPRTSIVIATKVRGRMGDGPNDTGLSRHQIYASVEQSLKRLQTDYIDLYQIHGFDPVTPLEETMSILNDLVRKGKVNYIGASNLAAWQLVKANAIAERHGWARFVTYQGYYSLAGRDIENEIVPYCLDQGMGILPWSPLAGGYLTGKYRGKDPEGARLSGEMKGFPPVRPEVGEKVLDAMEPIAKKHKTTLAAVALAWLRMRPVVSSVIIGAKRMEQLKDNLRAADLTLHAEDLKALEEASATPMPYPQWMIARQGRDRK